MGLAREGGDGVSSRMRGPRWVFHLGGRGGRGGLIQGLIAALPCARRVSWMLLLWS